MQVAKTRQGPFIACQAPSGLPCAAMGKKTGTRTKNFTLWCTEDEAAAIKAAAEAASARAGFPIEVGVWIRAQVMRAVADEKKAPGKR